MEEPGQQAETAGRAGTVDVEEVARFSALAETWWDPEGDFAPIHKFNPVRLEFIRNRLCRHFGLDERSGRPFTGLEVLDLGCGGGLLSEPIARLGAAVTGVDAADRNIGIARAHAERSGLSIDYRHTTAEDLAESGDRFDVILNMELIEHVADSDLLMRSCATLLKPGGQMIVATLNRTLKSYAMAILGAEYVLRWLPRGTHNWRKFITPNEIQSLVGDAGLVSRELVGVGYDPFRDRWSLCQDTSVNYMLVAEKPKA